MPNKTPYIYTIPGVMIAPIKAARAKQLLESSKPQEQPFIAGLTRFWNMTEEDAAAIVPEHPRFGWYGFPMIPKNEAVENNQWLQFENVAMNQMFVKTAKQALHSACLSADLNFNSNVDYVYIKLDFKEKVSKVL